MTRIVLLALAALIMLSGCSHRQPNAARQEIEDKYRVSLYRYGHMLVDEFDEEGPLDLRESLKAVEMSRKFQYEDVYWR